MNLLSYLFEDNSKAVIVCQTELREQDVCWWEARPCLLRAGDESFRNWNPLWSAGFDSVIRSIGHHIMAKATLSITAVLCDHHLVGRNESHGDFAILRITGNERRHVAVDGRFANCFTDVRITVASHPLAIELDPQPIVTECEHAKVVASGFVDAINLCSGDDSAS